MHDFRDDFRWAAGSIALHSPAVKLAHARERHGPAGAPWRLVAALDSAPGAPVSSWLDLEPARRRAVAADGNLAHDAVLHRQPVTTLDDHLARGLRVEALAELVEGVRAARRRTTTTRSWPRTTSRFGPPILRPPSLRDFYAFEGHVATMWGRRGAEVPEAWYRLPIFYFSNVSEIRGPGRAGLGAGGLDRARLRAGGRGARRHAGSRPPGRPRRGGDRRLHDLQRLVGPRPAARRDDGPARAGQGQGLRDARSGRGS